MKAQNLELAWTVQRQVVEMLRSSSQAVKGEPSFTEHVPVCRLFLGAPGVSFHLVLTATREPGANTLSSSA